MICIKNGILHTAITKDIFVADLLIDHGKIVKIGKTFLLKMRKRSMHPDITCILAL